MIPSSDLPKLCSNNKCRKVMDVPLEGWKCENGLSVELCKGCFVTFNTGKFCELYHDKSNGWRRCISCKKRIHYGCLASQSLYVRSKPRGIKCLDCTQQHDQILIATRMTSSPGTSITRPNFVETSGNSTGKAASFLLNSSNNRSQLEHITRGHVPSPPLGDQRMNEDERLVVGSSKISAISGVKIHCKELTTPNPTPLARVLPTVLMAKDKEKMSEKGNSSTEAKARNQKPRSEHRYVPRLTEQELKHMSRGSNVEVTPLFEKVLTVSDTGKIGRLVLPKKCAEGHFPSIDIPEGKPVVIQDLDGKDWEFNFRYWPNNNSRMYVLEGFNYYVTSMKLQAGDTVMFGRLEPEGKLIMGHRNGSSASSSSDIGLFQKAKTPYPLMRKAKLNVVTGSTSMGVPKGTTKSTMFSTFSKAKQTDLINVHSDVVGPKSSILVKRKRSKTGMLMESTTNEVLKDKTTSTMLSMLSRKTNDPINIHSNVCGSISSIHANRKNSEMGMVIESTANKVLKDKTTLTLPATLTHENPNDSINIYSDVLGLKSHVRSNRRDSEMGILIENTNIGVLKEKTTSTMPSMLSHEKPNHPINIHSDVRGSKSCSRANRKNSEMGTVIESTTNRVLKDKTTSTMPSTLISHENPNDPINIHSDVHGSKSCIRTDRKNSEKSMLSQEKRNNSASVHSKSNVVGPKVPIRRKRKQWEIHGLTRKTTDHENKMDNLALSFESGQELIRSRPGSNPPSKMVFEGVKLKSYKDDPVIGRPSMFTKLDQGIVQWAQCEKCYKWRKVPVQAEMPANWTCRQNHWDPLRLRCSAKEELTRDMIKNIFPAKNQGSLKKMKTGNMEPERVDQTVEEHDVVGVTRVEKGMAIPEPQKTNKKHPRHRAGCACIVCMQAPSGSNHKPSCECCRCTTTRRRRVLNPRRGRKRSKNAGRKPKNTKISTSSRKTQKALPQPENVAKPPEIGTSNSNHQMVTIFDPEVDDQNAESLSGSSPKHLFDLNLPPEPEGDIDSVVPSGGNI